MAKVIILNGPAGCGKDTLARALVEMGFAKGVASFKNPMFNIAMAALGQDAYREFLDGYDDRARKEKPEGFLNGLSRRQFMIAISEQFIKPVFGDDYFGKYLAGNLPDGDEVFVVSDGGFASEVAPIVAAGHDVRIVRLHRDGHTFEGDSRGYLYDIDGVKYYDTYIIPGYVKSNAIGIALRLGL
ncbi:putative deoxynucleotide kinase [Escherichia phage vB_EcoS_fTaEco03]|nr:putative deoxynucleotide kinase [Escherichia phage vB_EcoS_fTaEco03]